VTLATLYFFAHQPFRLRRWQDRDAHRPVDPADLERHYFDEDLDRDIFQKVARKCYVPATALLRETLSKYASSDKPFKVAFGLSGTFLEQARRWAPEVIDLFRDLVKTGRVELCGETYYHGLSSLFDDDKTEFRAQVAKHSDLVHQLFGVRPVVFRNTEMLFNDSISRTIRDLGFRGILTEGVDWLMANWRSPDFVYSSASGLPVLLRNYRLSDDVGYRFSRTSLRAEQFASWLGENTDPCVLVAMDYEAIGEHMWSDTGIFDFIAALPEAVARYPQIEWSTPSETIDRIHAVGEVRVGDFSTISWADRERDTSAWLRSEMQQFCFEETKRMAGAIRATGDPHFLDVWRKMQTSDHLYYLSDKSMNDGDVHKYFSAYGPVVDGFVRLHTALVDLKRRAEARMTLG
jgi:alpha-amylase